MDGPSVKICGLTRPGDAVLALGAGAEFGGVIGFDGSPRYVAPESELESVLLRALPGRRGVWVGVEPHPEEGAAALARGFGRIQAHFDPGGDWDPVRFQAAVPRESLWLAPRLPSLDAFREEWIGLAEAFLIDGFAPDRFGGTGKVVEGAAFARLRAHFPGETFILAGGLSPDNVAGAVEASGAVRIDVNSGVESAPGVKDPEKIRCLFAALG